MVEDDIFQKYLNKYFERDLKIFIYSKKELLIFLASIIDFINKKENKLRVRSDLKLNKYNIILSVFNKSMKFTKNLEYYLFVLFDFYFNQYELYEYIASMEDYYVSMYDAYLLNYDKISN